MLFSSTVFLYAFLPCTLLLYYLVRLLFPHTTVPRNMVLLLGSIFFYAWGERKFVFVMLGSIAVNYTLGLLLGGRRYRRLFLILGVTANLGLLFVCKYLTFTLTNLNAVLPLPFSVPEIALPIGISFFTFQSMSYLIDVYRGDAAVQKNPFDLALYVALFPQLIAGPIVRYNTVAEQIKERRETVAAFSDGFCRFLVGLSKKVLLANNMGLLADKAFAAENPTPAFAWLGALAYTLQIFYDFAGYSDMAIGLGAMFGFTFLENFDYPYISTSVTEFWRRWHISLGTWFRDYVYFPLGGSRVKSRARLVFNLAVVWILTGIWHGAAWNFLLWGVLYFILLTVEKLFFARYLKDGKPLWAKLIGWAYTFLFVMLGWVLFRAEDLPSAARYLGSMFGLRPYDTGDTAALLFLGQKRIYFALALLFCMPLVPYLRKKCAARYGEGRGGAALAVCADTVYALVCGVLFLVCTAYLLKSTYNPFIYFNF